MAGFISKKAGLTGLLYTWCDFGITVGKNKKSDDWFHGSFFIWNGFMKMMENFMVI